MEKIKWIEEYLDEAQRLAWDEGCEPALKLLNRLLYEEPGYARLHFMLGIIYTQYAEDDKKAERHFRLAIHFDEQLAESYLHLGELLSDQERWDEAIEIYTKGLTARRAPKSTLLAGVGKAYELKRKYKKAIDTYREALGYSAELWNCVIIEHSIKRCKRKQR